MLDVEPRTTWPSKYDIALYWMKQGFVCDIGEPSCFACLWYDERWELLPNDTDSHLRKIWQGAKGLERCHLVPRALGGSLEVSNMVLLCEECHLAAPDFAAPGYMLKWMRDREGYLSRVFREMEAATRGAFATFGLEWPSTREDVDAYLATLHDPGFKRFFMDNTVAHPGTSPADRASTQVAAYCEYRKRTQKAGQMTLWA